MHQPIFISAEFIDQHHVYADLIPLLQAAFAGANIQIPQRLHYDFGASENTLNSTLLVMPAWQNGHDIGIKLVTINPDNKDRQLPAIQGSYIFMDARTGMTRAIIEGTSLTRKRTAATSALAAAYLAAPQASTLLMVGTGALAPELIAAHAGVRPLERVWLWGRNFDKAHALALTMTGRAYQVSAVRDLRKAIAEADIISTATLSAEPLIRGADLRPGQHLDLVGSYKPNMREADDAAVQQAELFVDTYAGALHESGDLFIPLQTGIIHRQDIKAQLSELCSGQHLGRSSNDRITLFKSVGYALEDLVAARYYWHLFNQTQPTNPLL